MLTWSYYACSIRIQAKNIANQYVTFLQRLPMEMRNLSSMTTKVEEPSALHGPRAAINEMAAILSAHAENQRRTREFLQDMISDVSHQMKTPLSALKMYLEIIESHKDDAAAVCSVSNEQVHAAQGLPADDTRVSPFA